MDIGKYKKAMRPKKYLDGDFVVYDPSLPDPSDVQLETRENFKDGSKQYDYKNPQQKNQYITRTDEEIQSIVDDPKYANYTRKDFRNEKILTRKETERKGVTFKNIGARKSTKDPNEKNIKRTEKIKKTQGANISVKGSGQTGKQFSHVYPLIESAKPGTKTTFIIDAQMNRDLLGYNKIGQEIAEQQEELIKNKPDGYKEKIVELNAKAKKNVMNAVKNLGKEYKGQIGYFQVDPDTGEFKPKAGNYKMSFAGIEGENKVYKDMTGKERKDFERKISAIEKAKTIPGVTTADKIKRPESAIESEMFTKATQRWNQQEANEVLNSFCDVQKRAKGTGELACGIKEIEKNLFKEGRQAIKTGAKTPRLARLGAYMTGLLGPIDIPIELAFAAPHILRGDKDAAKKAMIIGLFGAGRDKIQRANEELGPDSATSRIYKYEKALEDFAGVYTDVVNAQKTLQREDLEKIPQKIQDSALEALQNGIVRLKEIKQIVDEGTPTVQEISESKAELRDLQATGTFNSDDFTYLGQALSDPLQYPGRLNVGLSGFTGEEGPDRTYTGEDISKPTDFVEAQADEMYPYQKEQDYLSKAVEDAYTGYTGKDILDRYADVKIEDMYKLPQAEKEYAEKGLRQLADRIGPQAALKIAEEQGLDPSVLSGLFGYGYLERQGFAKGGMSRRDFLKLLGTAFGTIGAAKAGLLKFVGKKAATDVITTPAVAGKPEWFDAVINKVIKEGTDLTEKLATKEREIIHVQQLGEQEGARVIRDLDTGEIRLEYESPTNMGEEPVTFTYKPAEQLEEGKTVPARFEANEAEPRVVNWDGDIEFDDEFVTENVDELMSDTSALKQYGTGKLDEKDLKIREIKTQKVQKINSDSSETLEYLESSDRGVMSGRSVEDYLYEAKRVGDIKDTGEPLMNPNVIIKGKPKK